MRWGGEETDLGSEFWTVPTHHHHPFLPLEEGKGGFLWVKINTNVAGINKI